MRTPIRFPGFLALALTLAAMPAGAAQADAEPWPGGIPAPLARTMTLPGAALAKGRAASDAAASGSVATSASPATAPQASPVPVLRPLPWPEGRTEITGETGTLDISLWMTAEQATATRAMQVAYQAAISVRPEGSTLTLLVNGVAVGKAPIQAPSAQQSVRFDLPDGALHAGFNRITLAAEMRHRVDCSVGATFELWTRIDSGATGLLVIGTPRGPAAPEDLPALPASADGSVPVRVVLPAKLRPAGVDAVLELVQALALVMGDRPLAVDFGDPTGGPAGVNLVLGSAEELATAGLGGAGLTPGALSVQPATPERRATLVVSAEGPDDLARALVTLTRMAGARAVPPWPGAGRALLGEERVTLRDLGISTRDFSGRVFRTAFDVTLPADLLPADYGSIVLAVDGATAAGLDPEAQLRVEVNGRPVAAAPLARSTSETLRGFPIHLPLGVFRPGRNHIVLAASLPSREDGACSPAGNGSSEPPRFLLLDSTALIVPRLARATRVPELSQLAGGALPFRPGHEAWLVTPAPDRDSMAAAATLVARLAQVAGGVVPFRFQAALPPADALDRLVVASRGTLDPALDPTLLASLSRTSWTSAPVTSNAGSAARAPLVREPIAPPPATTAPRPDWAARWPGAVPEPGRSPGEILSTALRRVGHSMSRTVDGWIAAWFRREEPASTEASLVLAEAGLPNGGTLVLVAAGTPQGLRDGVAGLVRSQTWVQSAGAETRMAGDDVTVLRRPQSFALGPGTLTPGNVRLVLAGWLSLNPASYGAGALLLALALALTTAVVLRHVGRPSS